MSSPVGSHLNTPLIVISPDPARKEAPREPVSARSVDPQAPSRQEDTVTLSSQQSPDRSDINRKKPSMPVSSDEKKSLLGTKKSEHSFSVYG